MSQALRPRAWAGNLEAYFGGGRTIQYEWYDASETTVRAINDTLREIDITPELGHFYVGGRLPDTVDWALLQSVMAGAYGVHLSELDDEVLRANLYRALVSEECVIESLVEPHSMSLQTSEDLAPAIKTNRTLRKIFTHTMNRIKPFHRCCWASTTIEEVTTSEQDSIAAWVIRGFLTIPSLRTVVANDSALPPIRAFGDAWPHARDRWRRASYFGVELLVMKTPDHIPLDVRQMLRALYECAGKVLPDHVIRDIADEMEKELWRLPPLFDDLINT